MSVTEIVARLRLAHDLLTEARQAVARADVAIIDGAQLFAVATVGSTQPEVAEIAHLARVSSEAVSGADELFVQAQAVIDAYCWENAGHGIDAPILSAPSVQSEPPPGGRPGGPAVADSENPEVRYKEWIAELRRSGTKISPSRVIRVARHADGRLVWLEEGVWNRSGRAHILREDRRQDFEDAGIAPDRIIDVIFEKIEEGNPVGYYGPSGEVYEVESVGEMRRVVIVISDNGYIVTSHPLGWDDKIRSTRNRK